MTSRGRPPTTTFAATGRRVTPPPAAAAVATVAGLAAPAVVARRAARRAQWQLRPPPTAAARGSPSLGQPAAPRRRRHPPGSQRRVRATASRATRPAVGGRGGRTPGREKGCWYGAASWGVAEGTRLAWAAAARVAASRRPCPRGEAGGEGAARGGSSVRREGASTQNGEGACAPGHQWEGGGGGRSPPKSGVRACGGPDGAHRHWR